LIPLVSIMSFLIRSYSSIGLACRVIAAVSLKIKAVPVLRGQLGITVHHLPGTSVSIGPARKGDRRIQCEK
jgi:hypothetical protein